MANRKIKRKLDRISKRSFYYFKQGYGLVTLPFSFVSWATTLYYLAITNIPWLESLFPRFVIFLGFGILTITPGCVALGYLFVKRSRFFKETFEIGREVNPYAVSKVQPVSVPFYQASAELFEAHGIDTTRLREIIEASL